MEVSIKQELTIMTPWSFVHMKYNWCCYNCIFYWTTIFFKD